MTPSYITNKAFLIDIGGRKCVVSRYYGKLPNGEPSRGFWAVFEVDTGRMVDWNQYLNDLEARYKF